MKKKIIKLSIEAKFLLIGISARVSTHKLSWLLNAKLNIDFKQADDLVLKSNILENTTGYSVYEYDTKNGDIFRLIENKNDTGILIKQLKNIDYLLKIEGDFSDAYIERLTKNIRETENVMACLAIDSQKLRQKELDLIA